MTAMWNHYCPAEKSVIATGSGEPCNWCDADDALTALENPTPIEEPAE